MNIKWFGQSCFLLTSKDHTKILIDPFNSLPGYSLPETETDIVTISHSHFDHNNVKAAKGSFKLFEKAGKYHEKNIEIVGVDTFHDDVNGAKRGTNVVFKFTVDGLNICHLGDLGHLLSDKQIEELGKIDILLVPVGGVYTIDAHQAVQVVMQLNPEVIIPMHYGTKAIEKSGLGLSKADAFLEISKLPVKNLNTLDITAETLHQNKGIVILSY